jgi:hypothetical protein
MKREVEASPEKLPEGVEGLETNIVEVELVDEVL